MLSFQALTRFDPRQPFLCEALPDFSRRPQNKSFLCTEN
jgi:hypothetical protein